MISSSEKTTSDQLSTWVPLNIEDPFLSGRLHCSGVGENTFTADHELSFNDANFLEKSEEDYIIFALSRGSLEIVIKKKDFSERNFLLEVGSALIIPPRSIISPKLPDCDGECIFTFLGGSIAKEIFDTMIQELAPFVFTKDVQPVVQKIKQLLNSLYLGVHADDCYISEFAYQLLMQFYRISLHTESHSYSLLVSSALKLISEEYAYLYGIDELASTLNVSKSHLIRTFTQSVGISPGKYLTQVRIENAKLLLLSGTYSVEAIANLTGYGDSNYFCKVFKKYTGVTPKQFMGHHPQAKKQLPKHIEKSEGFLY